MYSLQFAWIGSLTVTIRELHVLLPSTHHVFIENYPLILWICVKINESNNPVNMNDSASMKRYESRVHSFSLGMTLEKDEYWDVGMFKSSFIYSSYMKNIRSNWKWLDFKYLGWIPNESEWWTMILMIIQNVPCCLSLNKWAQVTWISNLDESLNSSFYFWPDPENEFILNGTYYKKTVT